MKRFFRHLYLREAKNKGFTLIELVIVLAVILAMLAIFLSRITGRGADRQNAATIMRMMERTASAIDMYSTDMAQFPPNLRALWDRTAVPAAVQPFWRGPYTDMPSMTTPDGNNIADNRIPGVTYSYVRIGSSGGSGVCNSAGQIGINNTGGIDHVIRIAAVPAETATAIVEQLGAKICRANDADQTTNMYYPIRELF